MDILLRKRRTNIHLEPLDSQGLALNPSFFHINFLKILEWCVYISAYYNIHLRFFTVKCEANVNGAVYPVSI